MLGIVLMLVSSTFAQHFNVTRNDYEQVNISLLPQTFRLLLKNAAWNLYQN